MIGWKRVLAVFVETWLRWMGEGLSGGAEEVEGKA